MLLTLVVVGVYAGYPVRQSHLEFYRRYVAIVQAVPFNRYEFGARTVGQS